MKLTYLGNLTENGFNCRKTNSNIPLVTYPICIKETIEGVQDLTKLDLSQLPEEISDATIVTLYQEWVASQPSTSTYPVGLLTFALQGV